MNDFPHAQPYMRSVAELTKRATSATIALSLMLGAKIYDIAVRQWSIAQLRSFVDSDAGDRFDPAFGRLELADRLVNAGVFAQAGIGLVTAILFLRWVHRLVSLTASLGGGPLRWSPAQSVWAFIIPFVSLFRPYQVLTLIQTQLGPDDIEPPAPQVNVDSDAPTDYRTVAFSTPPAAKPLPRSLLGFWWGSFMSGAIVSRIANSVIGRAPTDIDTVVDAYHFEMFADAIWIVAAVLAISVVRSLTARLEERFRRIRYSTPEALARQGIVLR